MLNKEELFFENETRKHQQEVSKALIKFSQLLLERALKHDESKLSEPERSIFIEQTPKLKDLTYGSEEYTKCLGEMKPALDHHYSKNKHHPEFNTINGYAFQTLNDPIKSMDLVDVVEMLCDWYAASKRHTDGNIGKSITIGKEKHGLDDQLESLLRNTVAFIK